MSSIAMPQGKEEAKHNLFKHILMATDFSAASKLALAYALKVARHYGADISIMHAILSEPGEAIPMDSLPGELNRERRVAKEKMRKLEDGMPFGEIQHKTAIVMGKVDEVLSSMIDRDHPDLLVLGTHGPGLLKEFALGSIAERVLRAVTCPVLTVGPQVPQPKSDGGCFKSVLFPTDFGASSSRAFPLALTIAENCNAKLVLLHMTPLWSYADIGAGGYNATAYTEEELRAWHEQGREKSLRKLKSLIPPGMKLLVPPQYVVETNFLADGILDTAEIHASDVIVMGASRTRFPRMSAHLPWAVLHKTVCAAKCPVLTVAG